MSDDPAPLLQSTWRERLSKTKKYCDKKLYSLHAKAKKSPNPSGNEAPVLHQRGSDVSPQWYAFRRRHTLAPHFNIRGHQAFFTSPEAITGNLQTHLVLEGAAIPGDYTYKYTRQPANWPDEWCWVIVARTHIPGSHEAGGMYENSAPLQPTIQEHAIRDQIKNGDHATTLSTEERASIRDLRNGRRRLTQ